MSTNGLEKGILETFGFGNYLEDLCGRIEMESLIMDKQLKQADKPA